ncbi:hypothetical protein GE21DRAFT_10635 [Neurospora crassa]|uniref:Uncharacterized protein n=1 Tax=Neurospora crassa (strain ATCC 24698 / 74-OR23-1A / CBS 708.71 / DSM 1257 / FGSC 987) TaxID=367110 RepID=Q7S4Q4_NEUCR|nr:hypothetical protein NCU05769 [Neurospora crassa OR74A]EAA30508.1 hypothetical protein NCU05769 [Neurospora crassa OR74A]KHE86652.1 hypothetical protein GE21DRAFT_10635 [Neurospora crassa]|eukprot:XP_959744.1 hypothetical protein NCU05769 [Neurospora crassa OR74A]
MPSNRTHIKKERDNPYPDIDDYRRHYRHDRSRSPRRSPPRAEVDKGKGKVKLEEEEETEEKKVLVRKRVKEGEYTPKPDYPEWLLWVAGAVISREDRRKHKYSVEKRGGSGASSGKGKGKGKGNGNDREHIGRKEYLEEERWGYGHGHQGGQSRDDDHDDGYRNEAERLDAKMEELLKLPHHVLEDMREEEEARHDEMLKPNYRRRKYGVAKREWDNDERKTVYERYMRSLREDP